MPKSPLSHKVTKELTPWQVKYWSDKARKRLREEYRRAGEEEWNKGYATVVEISPEVYLPDAYLAAMEKQRSSRNSRWPKSGDRSSKASS